MRRLPAILALLLMAAAIQATPANATVISGTAGCEVVFDFYPGVGADGPCDADDGGSLNLPSDGKFVGTAADGLIVYCAGICSYSMSIDAFGASCITNEPPLIENWAGEIFISGAKVANYNLVRIGSDVIVTTSSPDIGAAEGTYVAVPPLPTCSNPAPQQVHLVDLTWSSI